jgi:hypothetical protein
MQAECQDTDNGRRERRLRPFWGNRTGEHGIVKKCSFCGPLQEMRCKNSPFKGPVLMKVRKQPCGGWSGSDRMEGFGDM